MFNFINNLFKKQPEPEDEMLAELAISDEDLKLREYFNEYMTYIDQICSTSSPKSGIPYTETIGYIINLEDNARRNRP